VPGAGRIQQFHWGHQHVATAGGDHAFQSNRNHAWHHDRNGNAWQHDWKLNDSRHDGAGNSAGAADDNASGKNQRHCDAAIDHAGSRRQCVGCPIHDAAVFHASAGIDGLSGQHCALYYHSRYIHDTGIVQFDRNVLNHA